MTICGDRGAGSEATVPQAKPRQARMERRQPGSFMWGGDKKGDRLFAERPPFYEPNYYKNHVVNTLKQITGTASYTQRQAVKPSCTMRYLSEGREKSHLSWWIFSVKNYESLR
ncbi:MAG: hypothetical protein OHK0039_18420 [Bacteroidia bacterium]